jgi:tRNA (cmo5U34)-methyltransferase
MSVSSHLNIRIEEYDGLIRRFVPFYDEMLGEAASALGLLSAPEPTIVDLGIGTGALSLRCLEVRPDAKIVGVDADQDMLAVARARLAPRAPGSERGRGLEVRLEVGNFTNVPIPAADAIVACLALHHIPTGEAKRTLYRKCFGALRPGALLVSADCFPARDPDLATAQMASWRRHLESSFPPDEAAAHLAQWAGEDTYFALEDESGWLRDTGFRVEVLWRRGAFAVLVGVRRDS